MVLSGHGPRPLTPPPPAAATVSATTAQSQLARSPAIRVEIVDDVVVVVVRQFRFKRLFQPEINYRKYLDLCIIRTPDFQSNIMVKKVRIIFGVLRYYSNPQFIEPVVEVKLEDLQYMKQEPADESDCGATHYVKVRFQYANSYNY